MFKTKILIVDDEIILTKALSMTLGRLGCEICSPAISGKEAIKIAEDEKPDVVLMDIDLFGGMSGIEAGKKIKDRFGIPVIYITGYLDNETMKKAGITEPYEYLIKPMHGIDVKNAIKSILQKHKRENEYL